MVRLRLLRSNWAASALRMLLTPYGVSLALIWQAFCGQCSVTSELDYALKCSSEAAQGLDVWMTGEYAGVDSLDEQLLCRAFAKLEHPVPSLMKAIAAHAEWSIKEYQPQSVSFSTLFDSKHLA